MKQMVVQFYDYLSHEKVFQPYKIMVHNTDCIYIFTGEGMGKEIDISSA